MLKRLLLTCPLFALFLLSCSNTRYSDVVANEEVVLKESTEIISKSEEYTSLLVSITEKALSLKNCNDANLFVLSFSQQLSNDEKTLLQGASNTLKSSTKSPTDFNTLLSDSLTIELIRAGASNDFSMLHSVTSNFYSSSDFLSHDKETQIEIKRRLDAFDISRYKLARLFLSVDDSSLRMSPGDRMVWSEWCKNASPEARKKMCKYQLSALFSHNSITDAAYQIWEAICDLL